MPDLDIDFPSNQHQAKEYLGRLALTKRLGEGRWFDVYWAVGAPFVVKIPKSRVVTIIRTKIGGEASSIFGGPFVAQTSTRPHLRQVLSQLVHEYLGYTKAMWLKAMIVWLAHALGSWYEYEVKVDRVDPASAINGYLLAADLRKGISKYYVLSDVEIRLARGFCAKVTTCQHVVFQEYFQYLLGDWVSSQSSSNADDRLIEALIQGCFEIEHYLWRRGIYNTDLDIFHNIGVRGGCLYLVDLEGLTTDSQHAREHLAKVSAMSDADILNSQQGLSSRFRGIYLKKFRQYRSISAFECLWRANLNDAENMQE